MYVYIYIYIYIYIYMRVHTSEKYIEIHMLSNFHTTYQKNYTTYHSFTLLGQRMKISRQHMTCI